MHKRTMITNEHYHRSFSTFEEKVGKIGSGELSQIGNDVYLKWLYVGMSLSHFEIRIEVGI